MGLEQQINEDLKQAMREKDQATLLGLRAIKSAIILAKTEKAGTSLEESKEPEILQRLAKQRRDSIEIYEKQNRPELAEQEKQELKIIEKYLPKQMGGEELEKKLAEIIERVGASSPADIGKVMGAASKELAGRADGKTISAAARKLLQNK